MDALTPTTASEADPKGSDERAVEAQFTVARIIGRNLQVDQLLARHHDLMRNTSPEESCHVMTATDLRDAGAHVFALRDRTGAVCAVGALKRIGSSAVELKSMHTAEALRGQGLGAQLLSGLLHEARALGATEACLETGTAPPFAAARALYDRAGFSVCPPFGDYCEDPLSVFMRRSL